MAKPLSEQSVLIPGGTSGIGLACARAFLDSGARVRLIGRTPGRGLGAVADLGGDVGFIAADCAEPEEVEVPASLFVRIKYLAETQRDLNTYASELKKDLGDTGLFARKE